MQSPIEVIASYGAPTESFVSCIRYLKHEHREMQKSEYEDGFAKIIGTDDVPVFGSRKIAELHFLYAVQETIISFRSGTVPDMEVLVRTITDKVAKFIEESPWCLREYGDSSDRSSVSVSSSLSKKEQALQLYQHMNSNGSSRSDIINALMEKVQLSKPGATTYFHNLKKKYGLVSATDDSAPKMLSKQEQTNMIYNRLKNNHSRADIISAIIETIGTTPAGANTYYCAAKKQCK